MKRILLSTLLALVLLSPGCNDDQPFLSGNNIGITRLVIYDFDVDIDIIPGEDTFTEFRRTDSTMILQLTRTVDPDIAVGGDESNQTIYIILPNNLQTLDINEGDWSGIKTYAFTSERTVNEPVGQVTGGQITGQRLTLDNSWLIEGTVELSEAFDDSFPLELSGTFRSR
ncbi:hypothetical protein [Neolewinella persica]|uniref:hypothetical protein n=1 Tax=Neolewinella persica TaxID=70998 RepID=UPI000371B007|nr:hypothetical protein [Neolewinella persica]